ncbi:Rieske 2Fe-2S domain-containing protein [Sorangium sp. So ce136]|uniref:Rieske (2Fe-2S) protein n=1 Tax=Sorangium sp. So ce136 TaxID=3133284 RepID=UPI003F0709AC
MSDIALDEKTVFNLGPLTQIPVGEGRAFHVGGREVAVFRTRAGELFAVQARCPHKGGPLADGILGGKDIQCPLHGIAFDLSTGRPIGAECSALARFRVELSASEEVLLHASRPGVDLSPWPCGGPPPLSQLGSERGARGA